MWFSGRHGCPGRRRRYPGIEKHGGWFINSRRFACMVRPQESPGVDVISACRNRSKLIPHHARGLRRFSGGWTGELFDTLVVSRHYPGGSVLCIGD